MELTAKSNDVFFVTLSVINWIDVFTRNIYKDFIIDNLAYCQKNKGLEIYSYVLMTNHLHLILRSKDKPLSDILRDFKTYTSKELFKMMKDNAQESRKNWIIRLMEFAGKENGLNKKHQFWQNDNQPIMITNSKQFETKRNYIHQNPVKAGFVVNNFEYLYSSASEDSPLKMDEF